MAVSREHRISIRSVADPATPIGRRLFRVAPLLDRILGIHLLDRFYQQHELVGLPAQRFAEESLNALGVEIQGAEVLAERLPERGPVIIVANHPHGGIEGLVLTKVLVALRPDTKILANVALKVFDELKSHFLFVNPLNARDPANRRGLRESLRHLQDGGVLVIFPAGRTSFYQPDLGTIADSAWSRSVASLARKSDAKVLPIRFTGRNSKLFYRLGAIWYRFRLLMLARELMKMRDRRIEIAVGAAADASRLQRYDDETLTDMFRVLCASLPARQTSANDAGAEQQPLAASRPAEAIAAEIAALPHAQRAVTAHGMVVGFAARADIPELVQQIARDRERTFRLLDEGSGAPLDTDHFDDRYHHIFCWHEQDQALVGAYRVCLGQPVGAGAPTYLHAMFEFDDAFFPNSGRALELGRSFITPEYQRSRHALDLLWRGIGSYLVAHPEISMLYGTVSLSRQYDDVSTQMICDTLIGPDSRARPRHALPASLPPEWHRFLETRDVDMALLNALIVAREHDGKGIPVLLRHYAGLGARFHAVGVDRQFADTPGLLLSVDLATLPAAKRKRYLAL
ncbi:MAG: GNAT family N-acyltransferase [Pseudomonadota bacterium]